MAAWQQSITPARSASRAATAATASATAAPHTASGRPAAADVCGASSAPELHRGTRDHRGNACAAPGPWGGRMRAGREMGGVASSSRSTSASEGIAARRRDLEAEGGAGPQAMPLAV
eukprot:scaffold7688_cov130-Isochrysis_galbana.AAC.5